MVSLPSVLHPRQFSNLRKAYHDTTDALYNWGANKAMNTAQIAPRFEAAFKDEPAQEEPQAKAS